MRKQPREYKCEDNDKHGYLLFPIHTYLSNLKMKTASKLKSESETTKEFQDGSEAHSGRSSKSLRLGWSDLFPTASALLQSWENCPRVATDWEERSWLRGLHRQWLERGRPELTWRDDMVKAALQARETYHRFVEAYNE